MMKERQRLKGSTKKRIKLTNNIKEISRSSQFSEYTVLKFNQITNFSVHVITITFVLYHVTVWF